MGIADREDLDRRAFVTAVAATAATATAATGVVTLPGVAGAKPRGNDIPSTDQIYGWIQRVFWQGMRRPGYRADEWAQRWTKAKFRQFGLEKVRFEAVPTLMWRPREWSLVATPEDGAERRLGCFPLPYSAPTEGVASELTAFDPANPGTVSGKVSLVDNPLVRLPATFPAQLGSVPPDLTGRIYDPEATLDGETHVLPFGASIMGAMDPSAEAGAVGFVGVLSGYPGNSFKYFVPYDAVQRPIPGVWVNGTDGAWLREQLAQGPVHVRLEVAAETREITSYNVVGELPGADDETVIVGSHHDGPWSSAVEDASGISLVLAQARYWSRQPRASRPHRMLFLLNAGHMAGASGLHRFVVDHTDELDRVVLAVHLEHAALDYVERDGELVSTGRCVPRWFFTSRIPRLERAVIDALEAEDLTRSMLLAPDAFGEEPTTDGSELHSAGVPIAQFLAAPFYLFDKMDTLDKIDRANLVPLTRWAIRVLESTSGMSAAEMRAGLED